MLSVASSPVVLWGKDRKLEVEMSSAQIVLGAMLYSSSSCFPMATKASPFALFSASIFSLFLDGCSSYYYGGKTDFSLSAFLRPLSQTAVGDYSAKMGHISVSSFLVSSERIEAPDHLQAYLQVLRGQLRNDKGRAFVLVNNRDAPYADLIAKSGDILFLIHCEECVGTTTMNVLTTLKNMGFYGTDDPEVDTFVKALDLNGPNLGEQLGDFMAEGPKGKGRSLSGKTAEPWPLLHGKLLTRLLMKELECNIAVPVLACSEPRSEDEKTEFVKCVEEYSFQSFGWNDPPALLFVRGSIKRSTTISV
ncbi:hypothetical protein AGDE_16315 [Angomonas deanei]|uniref:Uncharacterized protein n=1 Tax=Angomonas deanei TaxID=59799 RepID=A0A7G2CCN0_9TRYP|nr:hypothetical protein AGDE_16315 [Angomonas deanei]CAD2216473.1 hypothetical protein, conserved [Angomonas deanei]|eukprot:EPY17330.1 hypothetical protein AGDE_16315 [Angomonas deanei]